MDSTSLSHTKWNCKYHILTSHSKLGERNIWGKEAEIGKIL